MRCVRSFPYWRTSHDEEQRELCPAYICGQTLASVLGYIYLCIYIQHKLVLYTYVAMNVTQSFSLFLPFSGSVSVYACTVQIHEAAWPGHGKCACAPVGIRRVISIYINGDRLRPLKVYFLLSLLELKPWDSIVLKFVNIIYNNTRQRWSPTFKSGIKQSPQPTYVIYTYPSLHQKFFRIL